MKLTRILVTALFAAFALAGAAAAQTVIERLVSPGPLAARHAQVEARCNACHAPFNRGGQDDLCAACHRPVGADIAARSGFHGKDRQASSAPCATCHSDHHGRGAPLVQMDEARFNHELTDYPLRGAHVRVTCRNCHAEGRKFRLASSACVDCHRSDEPHRGRLGVRCASCHSDENWTSIRFDHSDTGFALQGEHLTARCVTCHANERYKGTPKGCFACHADDDSHRGSLGQDCGACHNAVSWRATRFDHDRTRFPLRGGHAALACRTCHVQPAGQVRLPTDCLSCHRDEDQRAHQGGNGPACLECHNERDWRQTSFDHARETQFPLREAHARLACAACHVQPARAVRLETSCISCHRDDDAHAGQQGENCASCHGEKAWLDNVRFDHGLTRFPLIGRHRAAQCQDCHETRRFKDAAEDCASCHAEDDRHEGRLGPNCAQCHTPVDWNRWSFDHDVQTSFKLTGAHQGLQCEACHTRRARERVRQSSACIACHRDDDAHRGEFGPSCERCHSTETFRDARTVF